MRFLVYRFKRPVFRKPSKHGQLLRSLVYRKVESVFAAKGRAVRISGIDHVALTHWRQSWLPGFQVTPTASAHWDWARLYRQRVAEPYRLDMAIWADLGPAGYQLCGLAIGGPSRGRTLINVGFVAGSPIANPLRGSILPIAAEVAETYGACWSSTEVRFVHPLQGAYPAYLALAGC